MLKKLIVILIAFAVFLSWWHMPVVFLDGVSAEDVTRIEVIGEYEFVIAEPQDIEYVVSNIQNITMKKEKVSITYAGAAYNLKFFDKNGKKVDEFIINYYNTIRKDPFFYHSKANDLCVDYLSELGRPHSY